eukprot:1562095-Amphidinium_carterae.2
MAGADGLRDALAQLDSGDGTVTCKRLRELFAALNCDQGIRLLEFVPLDERGSVRLEWFITWLFDAADSEAQLEEVQDEDCSTVILTASISKSTPLAEEVWIQKRHAGDDHDTSHGGPMHNKHDSGAQKQTKKHLAYEWSWTTQLPHHPSTPIKQK